MFDAKYVKFKKWLKIPSKKNFFNFDIYANLLKSYSKCDIGKNAKILEIGYGNGDFLRYAKNKNLDIYGYEINPILINRFKKNFNILRDLDSYSNHFDVIVILDVVEHFGKKQLLNNFLTYKKILKPGGLILGRVPNCSCSIGLFDAFGDLSHKSFFNYQSLDQLSKITDFHLRRIIRDFFIPNRFYKYIYFYMKNLFFALIEFIYKFLFFGFKSNYIFSNSLIFIFEKK